MRAIKGHYEENIGVNLPVAHPLMGWPVVWAGEIHLTYKVRESGRTAYENVTGHRVKHPGCRTVRRVVREEAFNQKWIEEVVTPIDEYIQKGASLQNLCLV